MRFSSEPAEIVRSGYHGHMGIGRIGAEDGREKAVFLRAGHGTPFKVCVLLRLIFPMLVAGR
ncbi:hypothetical protein BBOMB_0397 [Bifidobacterium bombi DSM 19703]|uniref:Uncharacterized protein n=1 Tax=Bifidobacterium bombi DSM 19703 TaxID=1341695 RepID=A0A080N2K1_9BIFI|nr:hypothetical protein BBOMB_0397 [Bifidobacterium bombi DSM 19703]